MVKASVHILMLLLMAAAQAGCDPQTRHQTLTFFFTGVPPLEEPKPGIEVETPLSPPVAIPDKQKPTTRKILFSHPVWAAGSCDPCHENAGSYSTPGVAKRSMAVFSTGGGMPGGKLTRPKRELCIQCHTDKTPMRALTDKLWLHNTMAKGDCLACHDPHQSTNAKILRQPSAILCLPCHKAGTFLETPVHQTEAECLSCHNPHMGINKNLLTKEYREQKTNASEYPGTLETLRLK